jgi:hypothetical protein
MTACYRPDTRHAALEQSPQKNKALFVSVLNNENASFELRQTALSTLVKIDPLLAESTTVTWLGKVSASQKSNLVSTLSSTPQGADILLTLLDTPSLALKDFTLPIAERTANSRKKRG